MIGKTISHYKIIEKLGEGGMGIVYKAEDSKLKRQVALKFLSPKSLSGEEEKNRFKREAQAAASLNHPNIATVFEIDEYEGDMFIAMEYIEGQNLKQMVESGPLKLKDVVRIGSQIAEGLHAAHTKDIIHRDIKSANIMITENGQVKIMDFGLAKLSNVSMLTQEGTTVGTVSYMSPEQTHGESVDYRTDIWSLGVIIYEMVSGQLPFKGQYDSAVIYSIMHEEAEPIMKFRWILRR
jgi:serine/threonine protein kinase